jgi:L-rhamnonate dehydratase
VCCCVPAVRHLEYFHDHVRIEGMLFDGVVLPKDGRLYPDLSRPGIGLELRTADARRYEAA